MPFLQISPSLNDREMGFWEYKNVYLHSFEEIDVIHPNLREKF